jgi:catechol 2,3-dioxygenase-like lactoylglutathione lyase family enzyme
MTIEINGMAHVILTVSRFEVAREFYRKLLPEFGMKPVFDGDKLFYCVGARTAIGIEPCDPALAGERFVQQRVGLHHLCLRARSREDVDRCAAVLKEMDATIVRGPHEGNWAPGYYYVLFEDPDGIRSELCARSWSSRGWDSVQPHDGLRLRFWTQVYRRQRDDLPPVAL